ncbi:hypothetical protein ACH5RR_000298 [Cinchona calisaya]|uniref:Uncharacterized protein n=1 Tax=Cinchona calisaya TaxID=153742 RepID=A0ABD3B075_9GENT
MVPLSTGLKLRLATLATAFHCFFGKAPSKDAPHLLCSSPPGIRFATCLGIFRMLLMLVFVISYFIFQSREHFLSFGEIDTQQSGCFHANMMYYAIGITKEKFMN